MRIFITGGTTGIGLELAKRYLARGDQVGLCGRNLEKLPSELLSLGQKMQQLRLYQVDVKNRTEVLSAIASFWNCGDGIDLVIANAGRSVGAKTSQPDFFLAQEVIVTNLLGVLYTFEGCLKFMLEKGQGHIAAVASVAGMVGLPGAGPYSASKAGVIKLCESYSIDLRPKGIHVSCICPGFIDTPLTQQNDHPMPFMISSEEASKRMIRALDRKMPLYIFPIPMKLAIIFLEKMPRWLYRFLMQLKLINFSKEQES